MQALGNGSAAAFMAMVAIPTLTGVIALQSCFSGERLALSAAFTTLSFLLTWLMAVSHRRVGRITEHYLVDLFARSE